MNSLRNTIIAVIIGTVVGLLCGEITARLWLRCIANEPQVIRFSSVADIPEKLRYTGHPYLNYYPTPNFISESGLCKHNSLGFRGDEFHVVKPEGRYRIVLMGGSTTYTSHIDNDSLTFPVQLERILRVKYGDGIQVINAGASGYTTWESLANLQFRVLDLKPDVLFIYHPVNDIIPRLEDDYFGDNTGYRRQWSLPSEPWWETSAFLRIISRGMHWTEPLLDLHHWVMDQGWDPQTANATDSVNIQRCIERLKQHPPIYYRRNLENIILIGQANNIEVVVVTTALSTEVHHPITEFMVAEHFQIANFEHDNVMRDLAHQYSIQIFEFGQVMPQDSNLWADHVHVNEKGAVVKAKLWAEFIIANFQ